MITLNAVTKLYNEGRPNEFAALHEIDLTLARGAMSVLRGPSGSGKTTLLSILACMARPTSGRVSIDGEIVSGLPERFLTELTLDPPDATSGQAGVPLLDEDYLILSTIHSAKGCEWRSVHLLHAADGKQGYLHALDWMANTIQKNAVTR